MNIRKIIKEEIDDFGWADTPNYIPIEDFVSCNVCDGDYVRVTKRAGVDIFGLKYVPDNSGDNVLEDGEYEIDRNNLGHPNAQWIELVGPKDGNVQQYSFFVDISEMDNFWFEQIPSPYEEEELNESEFEWVEKTKPLKGYVGLVSAMDTGAKFMVQDDGSIIGYPPKTNWRDSLLDDPDKMKNCIFRTKAEAKKAVSVVRKWRRSSWRPGADHFSIEKI